MRAGSSIAEPLPSVSVVICCYSDARFADVLAAVRSIEAQVPSVPEHVVVVDHNPGLLDRLAAALPRTRLVANDGPRGLSGARNAGIVSTGGDLVVFLDDDARAAPDMLCRMAEAAADPEILGVAGHVAPDWIAGVPPWFPDEFLWVVGCTYVGLAAGAVRNPIGAAMAVRRSVFAAVGGFTTGLGRTHAGLPLGCEETELAIRAAKALPSGRFVYVPKAACRHRVPAERGTWSYLATRCWAEGLSKAALSRLTGKKNALSSERAYMRRVLPRGLLGGLGDALRGRPAGAARAAAMVFGFGCTASGYLAGRTHQVLSRTSAPIPPTLPERAA